MGGIMIVGVINKRFSNSKMVGSVVNYSLLKGTMKIRVLLDANKKRLIIFTPSNPQGEIFSDLPKDGLYYPALQNKSKLMRNVLQVEFKFELSVPKDRNLIPSLSFSSGDENDDEYDNESAAGDDESTSNR
jgi:hypothetical protein